MNRITRKELKRDVFAQEVGHTVEYVERHRRQFILYGSIALAVVLLAAGYYYYSKNQRAARQRELTAAMRVLDAAVGPASPRPTVLSFPTQEARTSAVNKAFTDLATQHKGTREGQMARYFLGTVAADQGKLDEAEKSLVEAAQGGDDNYSSVAKLALAQVLRAKGKTAEAEKLLRGLMAEPTAMVSKEQATIALAQLLAASKPEEARKLLEPLRTQPGAVSRVALTALGSIPKK